MSLRVVAVSAPEKLRGSLGQFVLKSDDPASLYNACRYAGQLAMQNYGQWGESNWSGTRKERRSSIMLMHSFEDNLHDFTDLLLRIRPNLLLLGAMSICFPGAIACAIKARELLGEEVCIVLGGRHACESIFLDRNGDLVHHTSSPLLLMAQGKLDVVFDFVVSGEGEYIIAEIGEVIGRGISKCNLLSHFESRKEVPGDWIIGSVFQNRISTVISQGIQMDKDFLLPVSSIFGVNSFFDIFEGRVTAHIFSDTGRGCVFDCDFCSESRSVAGSIMQISSAPQRLFLQLKSVVQVVKEDLYPLRASAFIEDSTFLTGSTTSLNEFVRLLENANLDIRFGAQLTIDQIHSKLDVLRQLKNVGLDYLFIGIETLDPLTIGGMNKDNNKKGKKWIDRVEQSLEFLIAMNIKCGSSVLFGLGETQQNRLLLLKKIREWQNKYFAPYPISLNWAVQHPLKGNDNNSNYTYLNWALPTDEWINVFRDFGEASVCYPIAGQTPPKIEEVREVVSLFNSLPLNNHKIE